VSLGAAIAAELARALDRLGEPERHLLRDAACRVDAVAFAQIKLGVTPDEWQARLMRGTADTVALCGRRVGKSQSAGWAAAHHVVEGEGRTALCISPTQRQSGELFRLAKAAIVKAIPDAAFPTDNRLSLELPNGSRLLSLPGDPGTVRGLTASLVVLDETQSLPNGGHELFASVRPMLATTGGRMIVLGTPLDRVGLLFDMWEGDAAQDWLRLHVPSTECPRIPATFLESERRLLGEALFRREYLAEFSASATGMFDHDLLQGALLPDGFEFTPSRVRMGVTSSRGFRQPIGGALVDAILPC
jgi:hypothetical protein